MTATDELRRLLDERGVEWEDFDGEPTWADGDGRMYYARQEFTFAGLTDEVTVYHLTPEQAVEATLWRGTCEDVGKGWMWRCSECKCRLDIDRDDLPTMWVDNVASVPRYCPNCGKRVVE